MLAPILSNFNATAIFVSPAVYISWANNNLYGHFELPIYGTHQLIDALAVISVCYYENINPEEVNMHFQTFKGANRRFTETFVKNKECPIQILPFK